VSISSESSSALGDHPSIDRRLFAEVRGARRALIVSVGAGIVITLAVIAQMLLLAHLLGWAMSSRPGPFPASLVLGFLAVLVARSVAVALGETLATRAGATVTSELRRSLLSSLIRRGPAGLVGERSGAVTLSATRGLRSLEPYFGRYLPAMVVAVLAPPAALLTLAILDWPSALIALGLALLIPFAMVRLGRRAAAESDRQWRRLSSMSGRYLELLRGIPTLRALGRVDRGRAEVVAANEALSDSVDATLRAALLSSAALEFLAGVGVGLVAMLAGLRLLNGSFSVVPALAVVLITPEVFLPLRRAGAEFHASTEGRSAAAGIFEAIDTLTTDPASPADEASAPTALVSPLVVADVSVRYGEHQVLSHLSFTLGPRDHLVLEGPSGAGKTTLLSLLCGFVQPEGGAVRFGDHAPGPSGWGPIRSLITLVPQRPHVFAASIRDNLALGLELEDATLLEALDRVGLAHLAPSSSGGLSRELAESGLSISAGERQRLGLARALVQDRPLVLLDEPTAHLDEATTDQLRRSLSGWLAERTVIEASHRTGLLDLGALHLRLEATSR
jgi:ABC-type transport system involved in cytochrome bd biosynthesis fused ATPase/permease subunit